MERTEKGRGGEKDKGNISLLYARCYATKRVVLSSPFFFLSASAAFLAFSSSLKALKGTPSCFAHLSMIFGKDEGII